MKKIGVILSGSGVYDGSEIHESVSTLIAIAQQGGEAICYAPNISQHHVVNHISGEEMKETRNVLIESARIARGNIKDLSLFNVNDVDAIVLPGGFGAAKNLSSWAFDGPNGTINDTVKNVIQQVVNAKKPIVTLCISPVVVAKALEGTEIHPNLTVGTTASASPYDIKATSEALQSVGASTNYTSISEINFDATNKIISAPCYMMDANVAEVFKNVQLAIQKLFEIL